MENQNMIELPPTDEAKQARTLVELLQYIRPDVAQLSSIAALSVDIAIAILSEEYKKASEKRSS